MEKVASGMGKARIRPPKNLFLEVDHKRKAPDGLPSLAVRCGGGPSRILKKVKPWSVIFLSLLLYLCILFGSWECSCKCARLHHKPLDPYVNPEFHIVSITSHQLTTLMPTKHIQGCNFDSTLIRLTLSSL